MKNLKKVLALVLVVAMMASFAVSASAKDFTDSAAINHTEAVDVMSAIGVIDGYADGSFKPEGTLTREQAAKMITYMLLGKSEADKLVAVVAPYTDVAANRWSAGAIAYCANEGIIRPKVSRRKVIPISLSCAMHQPPRARLSTEVMLQIC